MYTGFNHFFHCYNKKCMTHKSKITPATSPRLHLLNQRPRPRLWKTSLETSGDQDSSLENQKWALLYRIINHPTMRLLLPRNIFRLFMWQRNEADLGECHWCRHAGVVWRVYERSHHELSDGFSSRQNNQPSSHKRRTSSRSCKQKNARSRYNFLTPTVAIASRARSG